MVGRGFPALTLVLVLCQLFDVPAQQCDETASLMQSSTQRSSEKGLLQAVQDKNTRKSTLDGLLQRTQDMLQSGVTPEVVEFAKETIDAINDTIIPTLVDETATDQGLLDTLYQAFGNVDGDLSSGGDLQNHLVTSRLFAQGNHSNCRDDENTLCGDHQSCQDEMLGIWNKYVAAEENLAGHDLKIHAKQCAEPAPPHDGHELPEFRADQAKEFQSYIDDWVVLDPIWEDYDQKYEECVRIESDYSSKQEECDTKQDTFEVAACQAAKKALELNFNYNSGYAAAKDAYESAVASIEIEEADRKVEFSTLHMILCLLDHIDELSNGSATRAGVEFHQTMVECEKKYDTSHLDIDYNEVPARQTIIDVPPFPCEDEFKVTEYGILPPCGQAKECALCTPPLVRNEVHIQPIDEDPNHILPVAGDQMHIQPVGAD